MKNEFSIGAVSIDDDLFFTSKDDLSPEELAAIHGGSGGPSGTTVVCGAVAVAAGIAGGPWAGYGAGLVCEAMAGADYSGSATGMGGQEGGSGYGYGPSGGGGEGGGSGYGGGGS